MSRPRVRRNEARPPRFQRPAASPLSQSPHFHYDGRRIRKGVLVWVLAHWAGLSLFLLGLVVGVYLRGCMAGRDGGESDDAGDAAAGTAPRMPDFFHPVREAPDEFPRDTHLPKTRESASSEAVADIDFSGGRDLVYIEDSRVWWESDHDGNTDDECDHSMHAAMEIPFRRLINLIVAAGWQPRVQEAYRATGTHASRSLHKQGRALDITIDRVDEPKLTHFEKIAAYEELAKLVWQAGFDWVYYEYRGGTGPHIHASIRSDGPRLSEFGEQGRREETIK